LFDAPVYNIEHIRAAVHHAKASILSPGARSATPAGASGSRAACPVQEPMGELGPALRRGAEKPGVASRSMAELFVALDMRPGSILMALSVPSALEPI